MCCTRKDRDFEEEARRLRIEEDPRRKHEEETARETESEGRKKPVVERVKEMVGAGSR